MPHASWLVGYGTSSGVSPVGPLHPSDLLSSPLPLQGDRWGTSIMQMQGWKSPVAWVCGYKAAVCFGEFRKLHIHLLGSGAEVGDLLTQGAWSLLEGRG